MKIWSGCRSKLKRLKLLRPRLHRVFPARSGALFRPVKTGSGDLCEGLYDGAVFCGSPSEFDVAADSGSAEGSAGDVGCGDLGDAGGRDGDSETGTYEAQDGEPLWRFLDDSRTKVVGFAECNSLSIGESACSRGEEDEGLVAKVCRGDGFAFCERMTAGQHRYEWFGEERFDGESFGWISVTENACVESVFCQRLDQV